jgi:hypothetical protein
MNMLREKETKNIIPYYLSTIFYYIFLLLIIIIVRFSQYIYNITAPRTKY